MGVQVIRTIAGLRGALADRRDVVLVPTMGNLHAGHLSLVRLARQRAGLVVASVFVNRIQFAPHEDFARYPRTLERDCELLTEGGCDLAFAPDEAEIYPRPQEYLVQPPAQLADILEGEVRPGFFTGVCTVVLKLFGIVQPAAAVFGRKDYQQLLIIRDMVSQFALPIELIAAETVRAADGLALSSRNGYLSPAQRAEAVQLHATLTRLAALARAGRTEFDRLEREAVQALTARGWQIDYIAVRRAADLRAPAAGWGASAAGDGLVVLGAARLGGTRLIDNVPV
jgi:pantoate--beta-alanine ligase